MIEDRIKIAVCNPEPGPVCLQGGCGYCGEYDSEHWLTVKQLRKIAEDGDMVKDFKYGLNGRWPNYWKKDGNKKYHNSPVNMEARGLKP